MAINKVVYGGNTLIDLTQDTATNDKVLTGYTYHKADGTVGTGTCDFDVDSSDVTAVVAEVLATKTFAKGGAVLTGTMPNNGAVSGTISTKAGEYTVPAGYHDGSGKVGIDSTEQAKIIAGNIKAGITILGVEGDYSGASVNVEANKNVTPATTQQVVTPSSGYDYLAQVTVAAIAYTETDNAAGGKTVTIGTVAP